MYIDINLLPREFRPKRARLPLDYRSLAVLLIIIAAVGLGWYYYFYLGTKFEDQENQRQMLVQRKLSMQKKIKLQGEVDELTKKVSERVSIIRELTQDSDLRFDVIKHINSIMPENLWLLNITENNLTTRVTFNIEGMSYTKESISSFLRGLEKYKNFRNVALQSITPSPTEIHDAFQYVVQVELAIYQPPEPEETKTAKGRSRKKK